MTDHIHSKNQASEAPHQASISDELDRLIGEKVAQTVRDAIHSGFNEAKNLCSIANDLTHEEDEGVTGRSSYVLRQSSDTNKPNYLKLRDPPKFFSPDDLDRLMDEEAAGDYLGVTRRTIQHWRLKGGGPKYVRISARCIRYRKRELNHFAEERMVSSTSEYENDEISK